MIVNYETNLLSLVRPWLNNNCQIQTKMLQHVPGSIAMSTVPDINLKSKNKTLWHYFVSIFFAGLIDGFVNLFFYSLPLRTNFHVISPIILLSFSMFILKTCMYAGIYICTWTKIITIFIHMYPIEDKVCTIYKWGLIRIIPVVEN